MKLSYNKVFDRYTMSFSDKLAEFSYSLYRTLRLQLAKIFPLSEYEKYRFDDDLFSKEEAADMPQGFDYIEKKDVDSFVKLDYIDLYDYLPKEDRAIHRSIACYVDKAYRQKATAATCYIRQEGIFLPSFDTSLQPTFKKSFDDKQLYILCDTEKLTSDPAFLRSYISSLIKEVASV